MRYIEELIIDINQFINNDFFSKEIEIEKLEINDFYIFHNDNFFNYTVEGELDISNFKNKKSLQDFINKYDRNSFQKITNFDIYYDFIIDVFLDYLMIEKKINISQFDELYLKSSKYSYYYLKHNQKTIPEDLKNKLENSILSNPEKSVDYLILLEFNWPKLDEYLSKMKSINTVYKYLKQINSEIKDQYHTEALNEINKRFPKTIKSIKNNIIYVKFLLLYMPTKYTTSQVLKVDNLNLDDPIYYIKDFLSKIIYFYKNDLISTEEIFTDFKDIFPMLEKRASLHNSDMIDLINEIINEMIKEKLSDDYLNILKKYKKLYFNYYFTKVKMSDKNSEEVLKEIKEKFPESYRGILNNDQRLSFIISFFNKDKKQINIPWLEKDIIELSKYPEEALLSYLYYHKQKLSPKAEKILMNSNLYKEFLNKKDSFIDKFSSIEDFASEIRKDQKKLDDTPSFIIFDEE